MPGDVVDIRKKVWMLLGNGIQVTITEVLSILPVRKTLEASLTVDHPKIHPVADVPAGVMPLVNRKRLFLLHPRRVS